VKIGQQVRFLCPWARYFEIAFTADWFAGSNRWQLRRPQRSLRCLLVEVPWQI